VSLRINTDRRIVRVDRLNNIRGHYIVDVRWCANSSGALTGPVGRFGDLLVGLRKDLTFPLVQAVY
jgi:hypothetical protein